MDGFDEKKWFVYLGDHHEGPFSLAEVGQKMQDGSVQTTHFVWCDGMADWKAMGEVPDFASLIQGGGLVPQAPQTAAPSEPVVSLTPEVPAEPAPMENTVLSHSISVGASPMESQISPAQEAQPQIQENPASKPRHERKPISGWVKGFALVSLLAGLGGTAFVQGWVGPETLQLTEPLIVKAVELVPQLGKVLSLIPRLDDVSPEDFEELRTAAVQSPPAVGIAVSKSNPAAPSIYVSSNAPDGTAFEVYVVGVPDTLLNQLSFNGKRTAPLIKRLGRTQGLQSNDGKPVPKGEYWIVVAARPGSSAAPTITEVSKLPPEFAGLIPADARIVARKTAFLGGPKDATYTARLKEYHDRLKARATQEIAELRQFADTLDSQFQSTAGKFQSLQRGKVTSVHRKVWNGFNNAWLGLTNKLVQTTQSWTPQAMEQEFFYGTLYKQTQEAAQLVMRVHEFHQGYFAGVRDKSSFDVQVGEAASRAQAAILQLKTKLDQLEKAPTNPSGMPRKDAP